VWGPPESMVEDNNAFALASIMVIPLCMFLSDELKNRWAKYVLWSMAVLCLFSALGSHSRGGFVAISAMGAFLWFKSKYKIRLMLVFLLLVPTALAFMPEEWFDRMGTIETYEEDESAMGRINAWQTSFNVANSRITGSGFDFANPLVFNLHAPDPTVPRVAHSIYFQVLGEQGWPGLFLFLIFWWMTWRACTWIIRTCKPYGDMEWMSNLSRMIQVSILAYFTGGAFLNLAYFELPYYEAMIVLAMSRLLKKRQDESKKKLERKAATIA
jgi:probable O-glycosylation ligase, exosortase system type 1-associated